MIAESLLKSIDLGRSGRNHGISMNMPKLESLIDGVTKGTNTLIFSNSGTGKTSIALFAYIYQPLSQHLDDDKFKIIYFSLEMSAEILLAKLLSTHIFYTYGIEVGVKELLSRKKDYILSDDLYHIVQECKPWLEKVEAHLTIYDKNSNADTIYAITMSELKKYGTFKEEEKRSIYIPNDPDRIVLAVVDHVGLLTPKNRTLKEEIDLTSKYAVTLRNRTGMSWVFIQQTNRDQGNIERYKQGKSAFNLNDTKDSGNIVQDSEIVLAVYNPFRDGLKTYKKYNVELMENHFRSIMCLKNRYGASEKEIGCQFEGKCNVWIELPMPNEIYDYEKYKSPMWILNKEDKKEEIKEELTEKDQNTQQSKFIL